MSMERDVRESRGEYLGLLLRRSRTVRGRVGGRGRIILILALILGTGVTIRIGTVCGGSLLIESARFVSLSLVQIALLRPDLHGLGGVGSMQGEISGVFGLSSIVGPD
jgi:hypothetical protein